MTPKPNTYEGTIILGVPRSGTTLLRKLVNAHSKFTCPPETHLFSACGRFLEHEKTTEGLEIGVLNGLYYSGFEHEETISRLKEFIYQFHRDHAKKVGKDCWVEKTALDIFYLDTIESLFGKDLRFVFIVRHGLDVICSLQEFSNKTGRYLGGLKKYLDCHPNILEAFAHCWVDMNTKIQTFIKDNPTNALLLRYEDLIEDPNSALTQLFQFLGESSEPKIIETAMNHTEEIGFADWKAYTRNSIDKNSIQRWNHLSQITLQKLATIINPTLENLKYAPIPVSQEAASHDAKRFYQMGLMAQPKKQKD